MISLEMQVPLERHLKATLAQAWALWTTAEGISSWWGPPGFLVVVDALDLRPGGDMVYRFIAAEPDIVAHMRQVGMATEIRVRLTFTEVVLYRSLAFVTHVDFAPGAEPYDFSTRVELVPELGGTRIRVSVDPMHSPDWTRQTIEAREGELAKLDAWERANPQPSIVAEDGLMPCLWFDGMAGDAMRFYLSVFGDGMILNERRYGPGGPGPEGSLLSAIFIVRGQRFTVLNAGPRFKFNEAVSMVVRCDTQEEINRIWAALTDGGLEQPCGWCKDRFGVSWQVLPSFLGDLMLDPDPMRARRVWQALYSMRRLDIAALRAAHEG